MIMVYAFINKTWGLPSCPPFPAFVLAFQLILKSVRSCPVGEGVGFAVGAEHKLAPPPENILCIRPRRTVLVGSSRLGFGSEIRLGLGLRLVLALLH